MEIFRSEMWRCAAGHLRVAGLPWVAAEALARGVSSPALKELAGLNQRSDPREIRELYELALGQLGIAMPSYEDATRRQLHQVARALVAGDLTVDEVVRDHLVGPSEPFMGPAEWTLAYLVTYPEDFPSSYPDTYPREGSSDFGKAVQIAASLVIAAP